MLVVDVLRDRRVVSDKDPKQDPTDVGKIRPTLAASDGTKVTPGSALEPPGRDPRDPTEVGVD
ncbi:MAG: hypothetical protein JRH14_14115 [Deltaproteobacteria bacterium]|nr:hypothetical protein [Deltaproteobacteria bacterium]